MARHLLLVILMYSFCEMEAEALLPPTLTVDKPVITETDSVTLNCQSPSSVSECYFRIVSGQPAKKFSCLKTLTGTELLKISHRSSPAEVKVKCFYLEAYQSPESDTSSVIVRTSVPPQLRVNPSVIRETDSVTLDCQTPSSVSVSQCHFYTSSGVNLRDSSCLQSLTGTELLKMSHQGSSAEVKVTCFYTVKFGESDSPSPHSDTASITIHILKPQMSLQHVPGDHVLFRCSLPISANPDTRCNLYFGEASRPISTTNTEWRTWFCQFSVTTGDLLRRLRSVQQSDASCDYSLSSGPNSQSPRSDRYSLTDIVEIESSMTTPTLTLTTGLTIYTSTPVTTVKETAGRPVGIPTKNGFTSTFPTSETSTTPNSPESGDEITGSSVSTAGTKGSSLSASPQKTTLELWIWKFVAVAAGGGVTVGCIMLVSAIRCNQLRTGPEMVKQQEPQDESHEMGHLYDTIPEEPAAPDPSHVTYSTVQKH